jgi:DNA-binding NarL/FixJ family response regulator
MLSRSLTLALFDDHVLIRKVLRNFLLEQKNMHVAIQASDIFDLSEKLKGAQPDVLVVNLFMPERNGADALKIIRNNFPDLRIVLLTPCTDMNLLSEMLDSGIYGCISSKGDEPEELLKAIRSAAEGRIHRNKLFTEALYWNRQNPSPRSGFTPSLSEREKSIVQMIWEEKSTKEIADELFLGVRSIEKIRQEIKEKLGVKSTVGLLKYAIDKKLVVRDAQRLVDPGDFFSRSRTEN